MYNRNGNTASGFWLILGAVIVGLIMVACMDWSLPEVKIISKYEQIGG